MEEYYHLYAALMLYAAVHGPATFNERFGYWPQATIQPGPPIVNPNPTKLGVRIRDKKPKPANVPSKGITNAGSPRPSSGNERCHCGYQKIGGGCQEWSKHGNQPSPRKRKQSYCPYG